MGKKKDASEIRRILLTRTLFLGPVVELIYVHVCL